MKAENTALSMRSGLPDAVVVSTPERMLEVLTPLTEAHCTRLHSRKTLKTPAKLLDHEAIPAAVSIIDISSGGIGLLIAEPKARGTPCAIAFDAAFGALQRRINVWSKVMFCRQQDEGGYRIGVRIMDCDMQSKALIDSLSKGFPA